MNVDGHGDTPPRRLFRAVLPACLGALVALLPPVLSAQEADRDLRAADPQTMTVEELERYIAEQKAQLEQVRQNRDLTAEKARRVREALAEKEAERLAREAELAALCEEREAIEPGSIERCLARIGLAPDR